MVSIKLLLSVFCTFCLDVLKTIIANISQMTRGNSSSSSSSESDEDVPITWLKSPRRREIDELSGHEDDIPLSVIGKKAMQSILPSPSTHDEDNNKDEDQEKEEEEEGECSDTEEPWGGVVEENILPPNSSWFGMVATLLHVLIHQQDPGYGGATTVGTNGVVGITPRLSDMPLGGRISGAARICLLNGGNYTWGLSKKRPWQQLRSIIIRKGCPYLLMRKKRMQKNFINERRRQSGQRGTRVQFPQYL